MAVREARLKRYWTQAQLAAIAGVGLRTVVRTERGLPISPLKQQALADALGVERDALFSPPQPSHPRDRIRLMLDLGYATRAIAAGENISVSAVHAHIKKLRAAGWRPPREREE